MNSIFNQQQYGGFQYGAQQVPTKKWTNPLTKEQEQFLKQTAPDFTLEVAQADMLRAKCTHRDPVNGKFSVVPNEDGSWTCTKCGTTFNIVQRPIEEIESYVNGIIDILETSKMTYVDMPDEAVVSYYQMIPFLEKLPKLFEVASNSIDKLAPGATIQQQYGYNNPFGMLSNAVGNPGFASPYAYAQQPMMQQPMMNQPYQNGFVGTPGIDPANPFQQQMAQPMYAQQPTQQMPPFMQPVQMAQPVAQPAVAQPQATQASSQEQVQVQKKFEL